MLGTQEAGPYDWAVAPTTGQGELVADARTAYGRAVAELRQRIADGRGPGAITALASQVGADYSVANRAFARVADEGLVRVEHGRKTTVLDRLRWRVEFRARPGGDGAQAASGRLEAEADGQPMISEATAEADGPGLLVRLIVESADAGGAVTAALPVAREALGALPVTGISVAEA